MSFFDELLRQMIRQAGGQNPFSPRGEREEPMMHRARTPKALSKRQLYITLAFGILFGLGALLYASSDFLVDYWWFKSEGFANLFWKRVLPQWGLMAIVTLIGTLWLGLVALASRKAVQEDPDNAGLTLNLGPKLLWWGIALLWALFVGNRLRSAWPEALLFLHGQPFGAVDPLFGHDVGFYVFTLPFLQILRQGALLLAFGGLLISGGITAYGLYLTVQLTNRPPDPGRKILRIPALQFALAALLVGLDFVLRRYDLLYSPRGVGWGACYTDVHVLIPAYWALVGLCLVFAIGALWAAVKRPQWRKLGTVAVVLGLLGWGLESLAPAVVQKYIVDPNEFQLEKPYIEANIKSTLQAFGLDKLQQSDVEPASMIRPQDVENDRDTLENIRLWDFKALLRSYKQLQEIRTYYTFSGADTDRYLLNGHRHQVMLALRELDPSGLQNPTWVNRHLEFTHGYGLVMNGAGQMGANGQPDLWIRDLPPVSRIDLNIDRPQIYFGETDNNYVFVKTRVNEFDYPSGNSNARTRYEGSGGAPIGSMWRRLVYSIALKDSKILFSDVFTPESRIFMRRAILSRLQEVTPFITYDSDPYPAVVDGQILWIVDGYTLTTLYPYSQPMPLVTTAGGRETVQPVNYMRNSVKAVVNAYSGKMTFYLMDEQEPLAAAWKGVFPDLFTSADKMNPELRAHLRYPEDMFRVQARAFRTYHMTDANTFYNKEDMWETLAMTDNRTIGGMWADEPVDMDTYYVTLKLQGEEDRAEFMMMTPYTPTGRDNMIAWIAARCDGEHYGDLIVKRFSKRTLIYGPNQVSALINQTPEISAQLSLWTQRGSDVLMGHLLVVPVGNSLLYVQPLYLMAAKSDLPELKRVIVSSGGQVAWGETFDQALAALMNQPVKTPDGNSSSSQATTTFTITEKDRDLLDAVRRTFDRGQKSLQQGNWSDFGQAMDELDQLLRRGEKE